MIQFNQNRRPVPDDPTDDEIRAVVFGSAALTRLAKAEGRPDDWSEIRGLVVPIQGELVMLAGMTTNDLEAFAAFLREDMARALAGLESLARRMSEEEVLLLGELLDEPGLADDPGGTTVPDKLKPDG